MLSLAKESASAFLPPFPYPNPGMMWTGGKYLVEMGGIFWKKGKYVGEKSEGKITEQKSGFLSKNESLKKSYRTLKTAQK